MGGNLAKPDSPHSVDSLVQLAHGLLNQSKPLRNEVLGQTEEALKTGGVNARIPQVQRAVEASRTAASEATAQTKDETAQAGIGATPYAQNILAQVNQRGNLATSATLSDLINELTRAAPGIALGFTSLGTNALSGGANLQQAQADFNATQQRAFYEDLKNSLQSFSPSGGGAGSTASFDSSGYDTGTASSSTVNVPDYGGY